MNWVLNITGDSWGISTISRFNSGNPFTPTNTSILVTDVQLENLARRLAQFNMDLQAYKNFNFGIMNAQLFLRVENVFDQTLPEYFPILTPQLLAAHIPEDYLNSLYDFDYDPSTQPMPRLVKLGITLNY